MPKFKYFLGTADIRVRKNGKIWSAPLPMNRERLPEDTEKSITYGDYFIAVRKFLQKDRFGMIVRALAPVLHRDVRGAAMDELRIFLEKHGEFYHPARIEADVQELTAVLALNVALSEAGKKRIHKEYKNLQKLQTEFPFAFLPKVYGLDSVSSDDGAMVIKMFLGEWFQGYCEFHISRDPADGSNKIVVWDPHHGNYFLTSEQAGELYRQAAMIMTAYYNPETFEQISSWHHGAGDFVIRCKDETIDLKLITVRDYRPMFGQEKEPETHSAVAGEPMVWQALLLFFLNLAIRMRLDRIDGVGEIVWADTMAVSNTLLGFLEALVLKSAGGRVKVPPANDFLAYLQACRRTDLSALNEALVNTYHPRSPDVGVIKPRLRQHVADLYHAIQTIDTFFTKNQNPAYTI